jgi:nucleotide-binding universal stress UspA family protein
MKKILCPVDFSEASKNAVEYAAQLAKVFSAHLTLVYVRTSIWPQAVQLEAEEKMSSETIANWLNTFSSIVKKEFGVSCDYKIQSTTETFEEAVGNYTFHYDLVVMGTGGVNNAYKYFFGSNSFHIIEKSKCPVVVVPQGYLFKPIKQIVYAYDPDTNPIFLIDQLKRLAQLLNANVRVLHVSTKEKSEESKLRMEILKKSVMAREPKGIGWSFDFKHSTDVVWGINQYLHTHHADMLAMSFHHHSLIEQLMGADIVKEASASLDCPIFILWH